MTTTRWLGRLAMVGAGMALAGSVASERAGAQMPEMMRPAPPQIVTSATGEARYVPDRAIIQITVQTRAQTAAMAGTTNARRQRAVLDTLRAIGFTQEQLSTTNYSVQPEFRYDKEGGTPHVVGYVVSNTVRADAPRIEMVGPAVDAALAKGANLISGLDFYSSRADETRRAALAAAVARARADAEVMARAAGGTLGSLIEITSFEQSSPPPRPMMEMAKAASAETPIVAGAETLRATVTARWQYVAAGAGK